MANPRIKLKRSNVLGRVPTDSDLEFGELALNYRDGKLYFKNANLDIVAFIDSGRIQSLIDNIDQLAQSQLDSNEIFALVDNDYINSRLDSSLYLDSAEVIALIDSDYINLRLDLNTILDSAEIKDLIDSDYIRSAIDEVFTNSFTIDAETLNGESASYYLDYNNFTNTPVQLDSDIIKRFTVDSAEVVDLVDSTYVQARIDATYINSLTIDADTLGGQNPAHYLAYGNLTGTPTILDNTDVRNLIDSDHVQLRQITYNTSDFLDSDTVSLVVDSAYVQSRQSTTDSSDIAAVVTQAYVRARQDFDYNSLNNVPTSLSEFANDLFTSTDDLGEGSTNFYYTTARTESDASALVDSAYVQARQITYDFLDSAETIALIDSAYVQLRQTAQDFSYTSLTNVPDLFDSSDAVLLIDSAYVQARQTDIRDSAFVTGIVDSAYIKSRDRFRDSAFITSIIDSAYIQLRDRFRDSAFITSIIDSDYITARDRQRDSNFVQELVDSAYIQLRDRFQDSSLVTSTVDSSYIQARQIDSYNASSIVFDNTATGYVATNVQSAIDEMDDKKLNVNALAGNVTYYPTTDSNGVAGYFQLVTTLTDSRYDDSAVNIATGVIDSDNILISSLMSDANTLVGNTGVITVHTIGNVRRTTGALTGNAHFYYEIYRRDSSDVEHYLAKSSNTAEVDENTYEEFFADALLQNVTFSTNDKVVLKFYGSRTTGFGSPEFEFQFGGDNPVRTLFPVPVSVIPHVNDADEILVVTSGFSGNLGSTDDDVQAALNTLDALSIPTFGTDFIDSAEALKLIDANALDSGRATSLIDSAYVNLRADHYTGFDSDFTAKSTDDLSEGSTNLYYTKTRVDSDIAAAFDDSAGGVNVTINNFVEDKVDSDYVLARVDEAPFLDSTDAINLIDSDYVQLRQDYAYSSLTGTPTLIDSALTTQLIDSDYVQLRQDYAYGSLTGTPVVFDSEMVDAIIDSNLFNGHGVRNVVINENNTTPTTNDGDVVAIGYDVGKGTGEKFRRSVVIGSRSQNTDYNNRFNPQADANVVVGTYSHAESDATAIGHSVEAAIRSVVIGQDNGSITSNDSAVVLIGGGNNNQGPRSVAVGYRAGFFNRGEHNVLIGYSAGSVAGADDDGYYGVADQGNRNVILGYQAFGNNGDNKIIIGYQAGGQNMGGIDSQTGNYIAIGDSDINRLIIPGLGIDTEKADSGQTLIWDNTAGQFYFATVLDSALVTQLIDSDYVQLRQDFAYGSLTGTPTIPTLGTDFIDSAEAIKLITANAIDSGVALQLLLDSIETIALIDSDYIRLRTRIGDSDIDFGSHKITYSNVYSAEGDLPDANTYHGMFAHVHATGAGYFAHAGNWVRLANQSEIFDGTYASLTGKPDFFDSNDATILIDSAYVQARTTAGTDSAATIALIEATVDSAYVQLREAAGGGGGGDGTVDSAQTIALIQSTVDSAYVLARVDSDYEKAINQIVYLFTADSGQTAFVDSDDNGQVLSFTDAQQLTVFLNGILLTGTSDVTTNASTNTITLTEAADSGDVLSVIKLSGAKPHIDSDMINSISLKHVTYVYTADSGQTAFTGADDNSQTLALADNSRVSLNGILLLDTVDYTATGTTVTLVTAADSGDILTVEKFQGRDAALDSSLINNVAMSFTQYVYTADSGDTTFSGADDNGLTLAYTANRVRVYINGILQVDSADYTATNGTSVVLTEAADSGDVIQIEKFAGRDVGLDSGDITLLIDSAYIQARQVDLQRDSAFVTTIIDSAYINARTEAGTDSAATIALINANALDSAEAILLIDSAYVQLRQIDYLDSSLTTQLIDSTYVQARQITYTIPTLGNDFIDSAEAIKLITANAIDSGVALQLLLDSIETIALIDSAYVQARQTTYSIPVLYTDFIDSAEAVKLIDANALDSDRAISLIDSAYIQARQVDLQRDSAFVTNIIDSDYVRLHTRIGDSDIDFGSNKILYSNVYSAEGDLPSASTYHGMFAHVHGTGAGYFAHAGNWVRLANQSEIFDGSYSSLTDTPTLIDSALTIQLIDSDYVQARTTAGTDSAATIALIEATVDSAYVALREANSGGGSGLDSSAIIALIDSDYVAAREADAGVGGGGTDSAATQAMIDSSITSKISQLNTFENNVTTFTADSGQSEFTGLNVLTDNTAVYLNGILLTKTEDYTITTNAVTLVEAADSGYTLTVVEQKGKVGTHTFATTKFEFTADSGQVTFTGADDNSATLAFDANVGHIQVFLNGILLSETNDYTLSGGDTVTLVDSADSADFLTLVQTKGNITSPEIDTFEFTANSGQTVFTGADDNSNTLAYASGAVQVHVNGILLRAADYTSTSGTSITLTEAADSGDDILISAFAPQGTYLEKYKFTADSGQTVFTGADLAGNNLVYQIGNTQVFLNGLLLPDSDFTASSGTSITLGSATDVNDELMIHSFSRATTSAPITVTSKSDWQEQTQSVSVDANTRNIIDCSGGAISITFPSSPTLGDEIRIIDGTGNAATNNITINRNGNKIQGATDNFIIDVDRAAVGFVYYNAAQGWILIEN